MNNNGTLTRKPCAVAQVSANRGLAAGTPSRCLQEAVEEAAEELFIRGDTREYSRVIARRLGVSESQVDRILTGRLERYKRQAAMYESIVRSAPGMALEAAEAVWEAA